jgi:CrcB protein
MFKTLLFIGTGGFIGSISRFLASKFIQNNFPTVFPYGTFLVNITGCFMIGVIYGLSERSALFSSGWKMFLTVGFCGGFTTFSTFANENLAMLRDGDFFHFLIYTGLSVFLGIGATLVGILITKIL